MNFINQENLIVFNGQNITAVLERYESVTKQAVTQLSYMGRTSASKLDEYFASNLDSYRLSMFDACFTGEFKHELETNDVINGASSWQTVKSELLKNYAADKYERVLKSLKKLVRHLISGQYDIEKFIRRFEFQIASLPTEKRDTAKIRSLFLKDLKNRYLDTLLADQELDVDGLPKHLKKMIATVKILARADRKKNELRRGAKRSQKDSSDSSYDSDSGEDDDEMESSDEELMYKNIKTDKKIEKQKNTKKEEKREKYAKEENINVKEESKSIQALTDAMSKMAFQLSQITTEPKSKKTLESVERVKRIYVSFVIKKNFGSQSAPN